ncbi:EAL domain-containing protein [Neptuniibacter sp.]|uniref:EAL domain-containing protein n=1 Tax=Neptuniibacter sp. TaxID=1962643 RepID=UPI002610050C|nr:EAL domain-containing protein [Neptuniibacter sp.]MCP4598403.1 EAL domain-containing protein [Neptuniibacter sp.]
MRNKGSIKKRLIGIILVVTSLIGITGYSSFLAWSLGHQYQRVLEVAETVSNIIGQDVAKIILLNDVAAAADITSSLKSFPNLNSMVLYNLTEDPVYQYSKDEASFKVSPLPSQDKRNIKVEGNVASLFIDAVYQDNHLGYAALNVRVLTLKEMVQRDAIALLLMAMFLFLASYLLAIIYARRFTQPILYLVSFLEKITYLDALRERVNTTEQNEFGTLYDEVNTMLERIESAQEAQKLAAVAFEIQSGMVITNAGNVILKVNKAFTEITGYTPEEAIGKTPGMLNSGLESKAFYQNMYHTLAEHHRWSGEIRNRHKDGTIYPEYLTIQAVLDDTDTVIYYVASFQDLTLQKESEAKLEYLENFDTLTGLSNRDRLTRRIEQHLDRSDLNGWGALVCFDFKDFKLINDAYGHTCGDELLQQVAERISSEFKESALIARIGADEFAMWYPCMEQESDQASIQSKLLAESLIAVLSHPYRIQGITISTIPVIGITLYQGDCADALVILKQADSALHSAKQSGRSIAFFDQKNEHASLAHLDLYTQLLLAREQRQFELYYQPQHDIEGCIKGVEGLIRWNHPERGLISPLDFIPLAEKTGEIVSVGMWVIQTACKQLASWQQEEVTKNWHLAVNISPKQFMQDEFVTDVARCISQSQVDARGLKFELTESLLVDDPEKVKSKMVQLRELGIHLALDDFGTGYSSLQYLRELPFDQVKIDQAFVKGMSSNQGDLAIIKSILHMSEAFSLEVIAEGVETEEQLNLLKSFGCKRFQGYYFSRPTPVEMLFLPE